MTLPPESYVDDMPCDEDLLVELGRVTWAAARLHAGVRDAINRHHDSSSDQPFTLTLGQAVSQLAGLAHQAGRNDQLDWVRDAGRPSVKMRNGVIHAVTFTAADDRQAIGKVEDPASGRFCQPELRQVTLNLISASMSLPQ